MLHNEDTYGADTASFQPERFLDDFGRLDPTIKDPSEAFGFGRRFCPGMATARESIWITAASVLSAFTIEMATTPDGEAIQPSTIYTSAFLR